MFVYQNKTAKDVFYGDRRIKQIYLGNRLIFEPQKFINFLGIYDHCIICIDHQVYLYLPKYVNGSAVTATKIQGVTSDYIVSRGADAAFDSMDSGVVRTFDRYGKLIKEWDGKWDKIITSQVFMRDSDVYRCLMKDASFGEPELMLSGATFVNKYFEDTYCAIVQTSSKVYQVSRYGCFECAGIEPGLDWGIPIYIWADGGGAYPCFIASYSGTLVLYHLNYDNSGNPTTYNERWRSSDGVDYSRMQLSSITATPTTAAYGLLDGKVIEIKPNKNFSCTVSTLLNNCTKLAAPYAICNGKVQFFSTYAEYTPMYPPDPDANYIDLAGGAYTFFCRTADDRFFHVGTSDYGAKFELFLP